MELEDLRGIDSHPFASERKGRPPFSGETNCVDLTCSEPEKLYTNTKNQCCAQYVPYPTYVRTLFSRRNRRSVQRQRDAKGGSALARLRVRPASNPALMSLDNRLRDRQPQPGPTLPFRAEEWLENFVPDFGRDSVSVIDEKDMRFLTCAPGANVQGAFSR